MSCKLTLKARVGNLFSVSSRKNSKIPFLQHIAVQVVWKPHFRTFPWLCILCIQAWLWRGIFGRYSVCSYLCSTLSFKAKSDVIMSWFPVETNHMPYSLKLASSNSSVWRLHCRLELSSDGPLFSAACLHLFRLIMNLYCKLDIKERAPTNKIKLKNKPEQKQWGEGAAEALLKKTHATVSLISRRCLPQLFMWGPLIWTNLTASNQGGPASCAPSAQRVFYQLCTITSSILRCVFRWTCNNHWESLLSLPSRTCANAGVITKCKQGRKEFKVRRQILWLDIYKRLD